MTGNQAKIGNIAAGDGFRKSFPISDIWQAATACHRFSEVVDAAVAQEPPPIHAKRQFRNDWFAFGLPRVAVPKTPTGTHIPAARSPRNPLTPPVRIRHLPSIRTNLVHLAQCHRLKGFEEPCSGCRS